MIQATVKLDQPQPLNSFRFIDESSINIWLLANVGTCAKFRDLVTEEHPWHVDHRYNYLVYSFAREQDALMFALKFGNK